jgi:FkbM family methyltransferase
MSIVSFFHRFKFLRQLAKVIGRKINIKQKFHNGYIFLNAVEHSWAWTGKMNYTTFDAELQNFIHKASGSYDYFIDIGSNIGVMTIGTLLKNSTIKAIAVDPNEQAVKLLKRSLAYNNLTNGCEVINAVVGDKEGTVKFDAEGSVTGHVAEEGKEVGMIRFSSLLNRHNTVKALVKVDVEGYESVFISDLANVTNLKNCTIVIELHPLGFNDIGDPVKVFEVFKQLKGNITDIYGEAVAEVHPERTTQLVVSFN